MSKEIIDKMIDTKYQIQELKDMEIRNQALVKQLQYALQNIDNKDISHNALFKAIEGIEKSTSTGRKTRTTMVKQGVLTKTLKGNLDKANIEKDKLLKRVNPDRMLLDCDDRKYGILVKFLENSICSREDVELITDNYANYRQHLRDFTKMEKSLLDRIIWKKNSIFNKTTLVLRLNNPYIHMFHIENNRIKEYHKDLHNVIQNILDLCDYM